MNEKKDYRTPWEKEQDDIEIEYRSNKVFDVKHRMISDMTRQMVEWVICGLGRNLYNYTGTLSEIDSDDFVQAEDAKREFLTRIRYEAKRLIKILVAEGVLRAEESDIKLLIAILKALDTIPMKRF